ncbi:MAG: glycosyl transferase [Pseudomonadales bacterium]
MVPDTALSLLLAGVLFALVLAGLMLIIARRLELIAHPNLRSSHVIPTPSGGGVALVLPLLAYLWILAQDGVAEAGALLWGGGLIAVVGFWDDLRELGPGVRLVCHAAAVGGLLWAAGLPLGPAMLVLVALALIWFVNLYNFMDGIDGLAAAQCLGLCVGLQLLGGGLPGWLGDCLWLLAGCSVGFLAFNWPPARIFMGDVGSGFLGYLLAGLALLVWQQNLLPVTAIVILGAGFWFDASYTLAVRVLTQQPFTQAHRSHLYQKVAARRGHRWTTTAFLLYFFLWLLPQAWLTLQLPRFALLWLLVAVAPLAVVAWRMGAGRPE